MTQVASFTTTISPAELARARGELAGSKFSLDTDFTPETPDPNGLYLHKAAADFVKPSQREQFQVEIYSETDGAAYLTMRSTRGGESQTFPLTPRYRLTATDIEFAKTKPLIVHPVVAALATYRRADDLASKQIEFSDLDLDGCQRVRDFLASGGVRGAEYIDIQSALPAGADLSGIFAIADWMDTASRTPPRMSAAFIRSALTWSSRHVPSGTCLWLGTGSENAPVEARVEFALRDGKIGYEQYVECRREQLRLVRELGHVPILFPDQIQNGLSTERNVELINELLSTFLGEIVLHKLGTPFLPSTDYLTLDILKGTAHNAYAVKSSHPSFGAQMADNAAIRTAANGAGRAVVMHTGDDNGFAYDFFSGMAAQAKAGLPSDPARYITRNGFRFVNDQNISALLGYLGLNPYQSVVAIIKLSQYFHEAIEGRAALAAAAGYLKDFWSLMAPAMLLSQRSFFGPYQHTPAYTGFVAMSNRLTGVLKEQHGGALPHRDISLHGEERQMLARDHLLAHLYCGAIEAGELDEVMGRNRSILGT